MAVVELEIPAHSAYLSLVRLVVDAAVGSLAPGLSQARLDDLKIAVTEACSNAIEAHETNWSEGPVGVRCTVGDDEVRVEVIDRGSGFDPDDVEALPAVTDPRRLRHESGLGIALMRTLADEVSFTPSPDGTRVSLVVHRPHRTLGRPRRPSHRDALGQSALLFDEVPHRVERLLRARQVLPHLIDGVLIRHVDLGELLESLEDRVILVGDLLRGVQVPQHVEGLPECVRVRDRVDVGEPLVDAVEALAELLGCLARRAAAAVVAAAAASDQQARDRQARHNASHARAYASSYFRSSRRATDMRCTSSGPSARRRVRTCAYIDASGASSDTPSAPCDWIARSMTRRATSGAATLIAEISMRAPLLPTVSISHAVLSTSRRTCSISIRLSAIHCWITPCSASGLPNAVRARTRRHISSSARSATPIARMQWWMRPGPSRDWAMAKPPPSSPSKWSTGTRTSRKTSSQCPSLSWYPNTGRLRTFSRPEASMGTSIIDCCRCGGAAGSVLPMTIATRQRSRAAPLIHHLCPLST